MGERGGKWGERGREVGIGYPLSTPSHLYLFKHELLHSFTWKMDQTPFFSCSLLTDDQIAVIARGIVSVRLGITGVIHYVYNH